MPEDLPLSTAPIRWLPTNAASVASPGAVGTLLRQAIASRPDNAALRVKFADFSLDRFDFTAAADSLETALRLDPALIAARPRLARCYNALSRPGDAVEVLAGEDGAEFQRALALLSLGRAGDAERELRAILETDPHHRQACRHLGKELRRQGRIGELLELLDGLAARGVAHAQLLYAWGTALALAGEHERARAVLFDADRVAERRLAVPEGFADIGEFNAALADELLDNPYRLGEFPLEEEANRGSSRVHALFAGRRPELIQALMASLEAIAGSWQPPRYGEFDPWLDARPGNARLRAWGLIQRGGEYEDWHLHRGGWLSGVYYVRVPQSVSTAGEGPGSIEYGPPTALERALPGYVPTTRYAPREGHLLLAPSHYAHRTIPFAADGHRISFAFDVVPERAGDS